MSRNRASLRLQPSETAVLHAASRIYAAYISSGQVADGQQVAMMQRAIEEAYYLATAVDDVVLSDDELG